MKLAWRQFKIFGQDVTLPAISIEVQPLNPEVAAKLKSHHAAMATCGRCHKLYSGRYHLSLISHLVEEHGVDSFVAIEIMEDLGRKTLALAEEQRNRITAISAS